MKQKTLTFKQMFRRETFMDNPLTWKMDATLSQVEMMRGAMKKGYIVKEVRSIPTIVTTCIAAKANMSKSEREKLQKQVDDMPPQKVISLTAPITI